MQKHSWTVAEAKARLSEILRRASTEGPQRIGARNRYIVVPEELWRQVSKPKPPLGKWLLEHMPRGEALDPPDRSAPDRDIPFAPDDDCGGEDNYGAER